MITTTPAPRSTKVNVSRDTRPANSKQDAAELVRMIPVDQIDSHPENPRENWETDQQLNGLAPSLQEAFIHPIIVRPNGNRFQVVDGERRYRAAKLARMSEVPAIVRHLSDAEVLTQMLVTSIQRKGLNPIEKARLITKLCMPIAEGGAGKKKADVGKLFGRTGSWASNLCRLLQLPEDWQRKVAAGDISEAAGRLLVPLVDDAKLLEAVSHDMAANPWAWATREAFERSLQLIVDGRNGKAPTPAEPPAPRAPQHARAVMQPDEPTSDDARPDDAPTTAAPKPLSLSTLCAEIERLTDVKALKRVQKVAERRLAALAVAQ